MHIQIEHSQVEEHHVFAVSGEIDLATAPQLESELDKPDAGESVVVDLTEVSFIDSTGLRVLITSHEAAKENSGRFAIVAVDGPVRKLLAITGVDGWLDVFETRSAALSDD